MPDSQRARVTTDEELIDAVVRGEHRVASELYDRLAGAVDRTLYRVFGRREPDHDDYVQCTFEQIVLTLATRRYAAACSLNTWASTIAAHIGWNVLRSRRVERKVFHLQGGLDPTGIPAGQNLERTLESRSELEAVRRHLAALAPEKAEAVFLHDVLGHELAEIATIAGITVAAAQSRLVRGRRELRRRLERERKKGLEA